MFPLSSHCASSLHCWTARLRCACLCVHVCVGRGGGGFEKVVVVIQKVVEYLEGEEVREVDGCQVLDEVCRRWWGHVCVKVVGCLGGRWDSVGTAVHLIRVCIVAHSPPLSFPCLVARYVHYQLVMTVSLTTGMNFEAIYVV